MRRIPTWADSLHAAFPGNWTLPGRAAMVGMLSRYLLLRITACKASFTLPSFTLLSSVLQHLEMAVPMEQTPSFEANLFERLNISLFKFVNKYIPWHKLPTLIGAVNLEALRVELRQKNLHDGYATGDAQGSVASNPLPDGRYKHARHSDGKYNSLEQPLSGCTGMRFGRNFSRQYTPAVTVEELWHPNPRMLSEQFMERKTFIPATTLNLLAAAWIQFQTHDWFKHETEPEKTWDVPLPEGDSWPHGNMILHQSKPDGVLHPSDKTTPGYKNLNTAWWW